jgi:hypothetical protein
MSRHRQRRPDQCNLGRQVPSYRCCASAVVGRTSAGDFIRTEIGDKIFQAMTGWFSSITRAAPTESTWGPNTARMTAFNPGKTWRRVTDATQAPAEAR